jgi:hypothetical protein
MARPHITVEQFDSFTAGIYDLIDNYSGEVFTDDALLDPEIAEAEVTAFYAEGKDKYSVYFTRSQN